MVHRYTPQVRFRTKPMLPNSFPELSCSAIPRFGTISQSLIFFPISFFQDLKISFNLAIERGKREEKLWLEAELESGSIFY